MAGWLNGYRWAWLRWDLLAGLTTAAVVVPRAKSIRPQFTAS
jgi:MFS superfamily sulfate permease-like transporter